MVMIDANRANGLRHGRLLIAWRVESDFLTANNTSRGFAFAKLKYEKSQDAGFCMKNVPFSSHFNFHMNLPEAESSQVSTSKLLDYNLPDTTSLLYHLSPLYN